MKPINKFKFTNNFCILGVTAKDISAIVNKYPTITTIVHNSHEHGYSYYTIRWYTPKHHNLIDTIVSVSALGEVTEHEEIQIQI